MKNILILLILVLLVGCAGGTKRVSSLPSSVIEDTTALSYQLLFASQSPRPLWIDTPPHDESGIHFLIGLSGFHLDERNAREDAMRHARQQFAQYTGVEVSVLDEMIESIYGRSSGVLEADIQAKNKTTQKTDALVSRIKAEEWYWQKFRVTNGDVFQGEAYKYWVKVSVPEDEYDRVKSWKAAHDLNLKMDKKNQQLMAQQSVDSSLIKHSKVLSQIDQQLYGGNLRTALSAIQNENMRLKNQIESLRGASVSSMAYSSIVEAQKNLLNLTSKISSIFKIDVGKLGSAYLRQGSDKTEIPVWLWACSHNNCLPVQGIPLALYNENNQRLAKAITNNRGEAKFLIYNLPAGICSVKIDFDSDLLANLDKNILSGMVNLENHLILEAINTSLSDAVKVAVHELFTFPSYSPMPVKRVVVGPVTYRDTQEGGEFAQIIKNEIIVQVVKIPEISVAQPGKRSVNMVAKAMQTRGVGLIESASIGSVSTQAVIDGADGFVETTYSLNSDRVLIALQLKNTRVDDLLTTSSVSVPLKALPQGLNFLPPQNARPYKSYSDGQINLQISSHLGNGQTYTEGDKVSFFVNIDKSAFMMLIYEDAAHNLIQILPNKFSDKAFYQAGTYISIPGERDRFEFVIEPPFGVERVWAFASTKELPHFSGSQMANGLKILDEPLEVVFERLRSLARSPYVSYGEAQAVITTVSKTN